MHAENVTPSLTGNAGDEVIRTTEAPQPVGVGVGERTELGVGSARGKLVHPEVMIESEQVRVISTITTPLKIVFAVRLKQRDLVVIAVLGPAVLTGIALEGIRILEHAIVDVPYREAAQRKEDVVTPRLTILDEEILRRRAEADLVRIRILPRSPEGEISPYL